MASTALTTYDSLKTELLSRQDHLAGVLPPHLVQSGQLTAERFVHLGLLHFAETRGLDECTKASLLRAVYRAAKDGMELGIDAYILPFRDRRKGLVEATYVCDYRGVLKLIERTGKVARAFAEVVYEHDLCEIDYGHPTKPLTHKPALRQRGKALGAYGAILLTNGAWHVHYMDAHDLQRVKQHAPGRTQDPWVTHETEMWRKTALKNAAKYCQLTPQVVEALREDDVTLERVWEPDPAQTARAVTQLFGDRGPQPAAREAEIVTPTEADAPPAENEATPAATTLEATF